MPRMAESEDAMTGKERGEQRAAFNPYAESLERAPEAIMAPLPGTNIYQFPDDRERRYLREEARKARNRARLREHYAKLGLGVR